MFSSSSSKGTFIGILGLLMWAGTATFVAGLKSLPIFQTLSIAFIISFFVSLGYSFYKKTHKDIFKHHWFIWVVGIFGICGNEMLYIFSFQKAPVEQADLLNYLWPLLTILCTSFLPKEKFSMRYIFAGSIAFYGVYLLLTEGQGLSGFQMENMIGYISAFGAAAIWAAYTLISRAYGRSTGELVPVYCFFGFLFSFLSHCHFETYVYPTPMQWGLITVMGITTHCLAYICWDFGVKHGNFRFLSILSYANPIASISLLVIMGHAESSNYLFAATALVALGGIVGGIPERLLSQFNDFLFSFFATRLQGIKQRFGLDNEKEAS
jgi:drug/metabolite transporter (DMT)-like permease